MKCVKNNMNGKELMKTVMWPTPSMSYKNFPDLNPSAVFEIKFQV